MKKRLDLLVAELGLSRSRSHAQQLIRDGLVSTGGKTLKNPSQLFESGQIKLTVGEGAQYVSRGALKLIDAINEINLKITGLTCLDIGVSTGGFSQVLLEKGADLVFGIDVGTEQLSPTLKGHPKLKVIEGVNARSLSLEKLKRDRPFDLIVMDVSFISIGLILPQLGPLLRAGGSLLTLVKPQFELGRDALNKKGVVKNPDLYASLEQDIQSHFSELGYKVIRYFESKIKGGDGNTEFFCYVHKKTGE